jgi:pentatricopeptide repeat protein
MDDARLVFARMEERDVITWTVMIGGIVQHDFGGDAYDMFIRMQQVGFKPDALTYVSILNACASARALEWVKEVLNWLVKQDLSWICAWAMHWSTCMQSVGVWMIRN